VPTVWFVLVAAMLVGYVLLDGFDLGAGIVHLWLARTESERRVILRTIGPVWDGNEVWLIAAGGTLYFAFPLLYASAFSGFYLPLNIVLWLLILRGIGIEFRHHLETRVWRGLFDGFFALSSTLLAVFLGVALANVVRGVPLSPDHSFFEPLWTSFLPRGATGILDWYTVLGGVLALVALTIHGCWWVALKTEDDLQRRARRLAIRLLPLLAIITIAGVPLTVAVRSDSLRNYSAHPLAFVLPLAVAAGWVGMAVYGRQAAERKAFLSSCLYLVGMLGGAAVAIYPRLLPDSSGAGHDITIANAATGSYALHVGLVWWSFGMALAVGYFVLVYRMFRGKVIADSSGVQRES
jgi:cytochrome d ubiquinol oxidase subunit II